MPDLWMDVDAALAKVPVNIMPLIDDTDFKTRETGIVYNSAGMDLVWNFTTTAGDTTQTAVTPTTGGDYDWAHQGDGMYSIEIPASGGASINNDTEGFGWFIGFATGVLPWRGPIIGFRAAGLNNILIDSAYSATRGLVGTALPAAAADAAGGVPISDAGGLDMDSLLITDIITATPLYPDEIDLANTATWRLGWMLTNALDDLPLIGEITPGSIEISRKAIGGTSWTNILSTSCSSGNGLIYYDEVFDAGSGYAEGDSIRIVLKSQEVTVSGNDHEITNASGQTFYTSIRVTAGGGDATEAKQDTIITNIATAQTDLDTVTGADGTTLATAQGNYAPAKAGDLMGLANDAITASKYDESTAFPVKSADTGVSQIARVGADGDTLETLSDQIDDVPTAVQNRQEMDSNSTELAKIGTIPALDGGAQNIGAAIAKLADDNGGADFDAGTDSLQEIRDRGDTAWITGSGGDATEAKQDTIIARIPAALVSGRMSSDAVAISGSTTAADNLEASALIIIIAAAAAGTLSTTQMTTTLTETTDDHYNGRIIIWTSGALLGQATDITDYDGATKMLTFTATTEAPSGGDSFIII